VPLAALQQPRRAAAQLLLTAGVLTVQQSIDISSRSASASTNQSRRRTNMLQRWKRNTLSHCCY